MTIWEILNIEKTTDKTKIRYAYAKMSKIYHPEREPEKFQELYRAYKEALEYAKWNEEEEEDFWGEEEDTKILSDIETFSNTVTFDDTKSFEHHENKFYDISQETQDTLFEKSLLQNVSSDIQMGLEFFKEYFMAEGEKDWKKFMTRPEFLRVQFEEPFVMLLIKFLKEQDRYLLEELPVPFVREMFFSYCPYKMEQGETFFEDAFTELFQLLYQNNKIREVLEQYNSPGFYSEVAKYFIYYQIRKHVLEAKNTKNIEIWTMYMTDINREYFLEQGIKSNRDNLIYELLAFVISQADDFSQEVYEYLVRSFRLQGVKNSSRWKYLKSIYEALEEKGVLVDTLVEKQSDRVEDIRTLMQEFDHFCKQKLTEKDRPKLKEFFRSDLFGKYMLDEIFLMERLYIFFIERKLVPKVFIEEYLEFYDEVYAKTNSLAGRNIYTLLASRNSENEIGQEYKEIQADKKEWVLRHFFEEGFNRVWKSNQKGMKVVYRSILTTHMETLANQQDFEQDLWDDGHLYAVKDGNTYVFMREYKDQDGNEDKEEYDGIKAYGDMEKYDDMEEHENMNKYEDVEDHENVNKYEDVEENDNVEEYESMKDHENMKKQKDRKEKVILTTEEYYHILEELLELFMGRYTCLPSEKTKWKELMEKAGGWIWQS